MEKNNYGIFSNVKSDIPASIVVFLVALPLCMGIALASKAPIFSGIISGIIGGIVIGLISRSSLSVSGPAAGLTVVVVAAIASLDSFPMFLCAVFLAGLMQVALGFAKAGVIGNFVPSSVIKGMLAAIGIIIILKQVPHIFGYDEDFIGDDEFLQVDGHNTFSELLYGFNYLSPGAIIISFVSIGILLLWETKTVSKIKFLTVIPGSLVVVAVGCLLNYIYKQYMPDMALAGKHIVNIPVSGSLEAFAENLQMPDFSGLTNVAVWEAAIAIALIASLETLLSVEATDKMDPYKRVTPANRELIAQGTGNTLAGLIGGLPITAVIVRSSANIAGGAKTKLSTVLHGIFLLVCVFSIPQVLNLIPLSSLAAILLFVGFKLTKPEIFKQIFKKGRHQSIPFIVTIVAIIFTDLLIGVLIGIMTGLFFTLKANMQSAFSVTTEENRFLVKFQKDVYFLSKTQVKECFIKIPPGSYVIIDALNAGFIDLDVKEVIEDFVNSSHQKGIKVEIKNNYPNTLSYLIK